MKTSNIKIDLELIKKKLVNNLTPEEEIIFQLWLEQDEKNEIFFKKALVHHKNGTSLLEDQHFTEASWERLERKLKKIQKNRQRSWIITTTSLAASIALIVGFFILRSPDNEHLSINEQNDAIILPGSEKATLILDGGEIIELDSKSDTIQIGNKLITIKNSTVDYTTSSFETHQEQYNTLVVKRGETFSLLLKDGTRVYLNSESTLHYPVQFSNSERMVELTGEGYFEVAYDYKKPFKVIVDNETVEVLGTSFNVHAYPEEEVITTTLVDGEVRIYDYNHPEIENLLHPNQQALLNKKDGQIIIHEVNVDNYVSWKDGYFFFQNQRLEDMMITLSRWYDIEVVFKNENVKNMRFGGKLKKFDDLNKFLIMIEKAGDLKIETDQKTVKINN